MSERADIDDARPLYFLPRDNLAEEVLIPGFRIARSAECMVGFFSSGVLADLAPGLATYIANADARFRIIMSPFVSEADQEALRAGTKEPERVATEAIEHMLVSADALQTHTLKCLSYLLANGRIEFRVALMRDALFHPKVWVFDTPKGSFAAHGSSNMTRQGIRKNKEQITVSKAWADPTQRYIVEKLADEFERMWRNQDEDCLVLSMPDALREKILRDYAAQRAPTEEDFLDLYRRAAKAAAPAPKAVADSAVSKPVFAIPPWLKYDDGPYAHQGEAVRKWVDSGFRGTLEMATGSGKTLTSMIGAYRLYMREKPLLVVVAAPYVPLLQQWCDEIALFGLKPVNLTAAGNAAERGQALQQLRRRLRLGVSSVEACVVSHDTLCSPEFVQAVEAFECKRLLIGDEAHNLGRSGFIQNPPEFFEYRLALSATPVRQYDPEGTDAIFDFFGPVVFRFTLKDAIGRCLVEYDYFVHPVALSEGEMEQWEELTAQIRRNAWRHEKGAPDEYLAKLLRDRRALLETAAGKLGMLARLLDQENLASLKHTLIYATDKAPEQLEAVNALLGQKGVLYRQLTAEETANRELTAQIIRSFQAGEIQVLTAKRVLDEGVNIPQISKAFVLASTTVERQWIQRRGRLLRKCDAIGKTHSVIHDFLALPPTIGESTDEDTRTLVKGELKRAQEFASLARNAGKAGGPLDVIHGIVTATLM